MKKITSSAPAKTIFSGEHAVVYGKPSLVSALDLRLKFSIWESKKKIKEPAIKYLVDTVFKYLRKEKIKFFKKSFDYQINSAIPIGCGLGSSAAFSVAAVAGLSKFYTGQEFSKEIINNIAYQGEKYFHKNPSGVDVSASCFGGLIFYRKEFEFLKNITSLGFKIPPKLEEKLYLIDSKRAKESTADMVFKVGKLYNKKPKFTEEVLAGIEKTTKKMTVAIIKKDEDFFAQSILENEVFLELLGVVSSKTKKLLEELSDWVVGKVTGAGGASFGSGFILFFSKKGKKLESFLKQKKINFYKFKQDYRGLVYEN